MKTLLRFILGTGLLGLAAHVHAGNQAISAARYVDAQGVEVIHNRNAELPMSAPAAQGSVTVAKAAAPTSAAVAATPVDPKLRVAPAEQALRDRDRVAILQQELETESRKYESAWMRLQGAKGTEKPGAVATQRMNEELDDHQKNIQALHAELRRAGAAR